jgi:hypothetical protein
MKMVISAAVAAIAALGAVPASATTFSFTSGQNPAAWVMDGVTLKVTGWSTATAGAGTLPVAGSATAYNGFGYGIINSANDDSHTIDDSGRYDFLRLEFSKAVTLNNVSLAAFGDTDAWVSYGSAATDMASSTGWTSFITNGANYLGGTADRSFSPAINTAATVWLIGAGRGTGSDDSFKLSSIGVTAAVPEPASWAMMIVGFGAVGATMRRRKGKVATTVSYA